MRPRFRLRLLWARTGYRPTARLLHRFNLHHTRRIGPLEDGAFLHRCDWCGASRTEVPIEVTIAAMRAEREGPDRCPKCNALNRFDTLGGWCNHAWHEVGGQERRKGEAA